MNNYYTYELIDSRNNVVFYVGKGKNNRMYYHFNKVIKNNKTIINTKLQNKLKSIYQNDGFIIYNKIDATNEQDAFNLEKILIAKYKSENINLCNLTDGGEGISGHTFKHSEETKLKMSIISKDKPKSESHKKKLKEAKENNINNTTYWKNKKFSNEHKDKLAISAKNKPAMSDETKAKISKNSASKLNKGKNLIDLFGEEKANQLKELNRLKHLNKKASDETKLKMAKAQKLAKTNTYVINNNNSITIEKVTKKELAIRFNLSLLYITNMIKKGMSYNNIKIDKL